MAQGPQLSEAELRIPLEGVELGGELQLPPNALGLVFFAHGSGSSRHSPRNQQVARVLRAGNLGTLLFDLLTPEEEAAEAYTRHLRFNIPFLARRLVGATRWVMAKTNLKDLRAGYFGSSTGAAAALRAAAELRQRIGAVVSRGGRADLAGESLALVTAPTLLIVGGNDEAVIPLNKAAFEELRCEKAMRIVPGASHLFEEPGALDAVAKMATDWFGDHFKAAGG